MSTTLSAWLTILIGLGAAAIATAAIPSMREHVKVLVAVGALFFTASVGVGLYGSIQGDGPRGGHDGQAGPSEVPGLPSSSVPPPLTTDTGEAFSIVLAAPSTLFDGDDGEVFSTLGENEAEVELELRGDRNLLSESCDVVIRIYGSDGQLAVERGGVCDTGRPRGVSLPVGSYRADAHAYNSAIDAHATDSFHFQVQD